MLTHDAAYLPTTTCRIALVGVFLGHFRVNLRQTRTQYSNDKLQHCNGAQFSQIAFLNLEICRRKTVICQFPAFICVYIPN